MRWRQSFAFVILFVLAAAPPRPGSSSKDAGGPLAVGNNLPATFHAYNINKVLPASVEPEEGKTGEKKGYTTEGKYHCLISEYDLDPVVMLLARGLDDNAALRGLLEKLNGLVERNAPLRLRAFVVFFYDDLPNVVTLDEKRQDIVKKLERLVEDAKLRNVVVALASKSDLAKYQPQEDGLTAVVYRKLKITASHKVPADKLDAADPPAVKAILADVQALVDTVARTSNIRGRKP